VVAGGLVTSNDAGLSAPDWPLSYGKPMPKMGWRIEMPMVEDSGAPSLHALASAVPLCVLAQLALGAAARHQALGILPHVIGRA